MTTTTELLDAVKQGDSKAFDALFAEHVPKLRGVLRRMVGHPDDVDDLTQQSLLRAYEAIDGFRADSGAGTWLAPSARGWPSTTSVPASAGKNAPR